jgi:hypothetical protein
MDMESTFGRMVTGMKESGRMALSTVMEQTSSQTVTHIKVNTKQENLRGSANTSGETEVTILGCSLTE